MEQSKRVLVEIDRALGPWAVIVEINDAPPAEVTERADYMAQNQTHYVHVYARLDSDQFTVTAVGNSASMRLASPVLMTIADPGHPCKLSFNFGENPLT